MTSFTIADTDLEALKGQVVVVTGASSGIGLATVRRLLQHGAKVFASDLNPLPEPEHSTVPFCKVDVTSWSDQLAMFRAAKAEYGHIEHVFANAGIGGSTYLLDDDKDENGELLPPSLNTVNVNLIGCMYTVKLGIHFMKQNPNGGSLVLTASASSICRYAVVDYAATKHAVLGLVRSLYKNPLFNFNLRINAVAPNYTDTGILPPAFTAAIGDLAQPADAVARSVALLMADVKRDGECVYSEKGRFWETENGEKGYHETLKRSMPEAKVEGILGILERFMVPNVEGELKAKV